MSDRERFAVGTLLTMVALLVPGFLLHTAPRFPGSLAGSLLGVISAAAMVMLLVYSLAKHMPWLKRHVSLPAMLSFHVYAGAIGAAFGMLHTGHNYRSPLGIVLVVALLTVVLSGFVGRYYLARIATDIREQRQELGVLRTRYDQVAATKTPPPGVPVRDLVAGIADLEDAIGRREVLKRSMSRWIVLHIVGTLVFYPLLSLHIWSGVYYGLRWWP